MKTVFGWLVGICVFVALIFGLNALDLGVMKVFNPRREAVRRQTFEQTKSFRDGMVQELQNMQFEYAKADSTGKKAMASIILHRAAAIPDSTLPSDLSDFIRGLRNAR